MFNEVTLALQAALIVLLYLFVFVTVRVIARDTSSMSQVAPKATRVIDEQADLLVTNAGNGSASYPIYEQLLIGRSPDCDIVLEDSFVSGHHARVYRTSSTYWLEDLHSTNGTMYKGTQIEQPIELAKGSEFSIGQNAFQLICS
ncbi:MAG TPA: FHA domain-containing protein [Candidatus Aquicultor sp.]